MLDLYRITTFLEELAASVFRVVQDLAKAGLFISCFLIISINKGWVKPFNLLTGHNVYVGTRIVLFQWV
jgi:hypothetical protein